VIRTVVTTLVATLFFRWISERTNITRVEIIASSKITTSGSDHRHGNLEVYYDSWRWKLQKWAIY